MQTYRCLFFERTSKIAERSLYEIYDLAADYSALSKIDTTGESDDNQVTLRTTFGSAASHNGRACTDLNWSPHKLELFVCAYADTPRIGGPTNAEPDGIVAVWNVNVPSSPEFVFYCQSAVMSVSFSPYRPSLIVGTLYTGLIVVWDMSSASGPVQRTPVQRSKLSKKSSTKMHGHSHPVYCQGWVGTQNAHNLITVCNDGKLCVWNPDNIDEPIEAQDLKRSALNSNLPVTSIAFADGEMSEFVVGGEDGGLYAVPRYVINPKQRHNDTGSTAMKPKKFEDVHYGPVLGLSSHPRKGEVDLSDLILSCSADWTLKLWHKSTQKSIITFEDSADYVYDVAWSPVHPTVFASIDGASNLSLWNLLSSQEVPVKTEVVNADGAALNCIEWNANGTRVMVGDSVGRCHLFDIGEAFCKPREDSWTALRDMVRELLADNATAS
ncbi:hypothetical protein SARC_11374 [Sphaeroforma arctica JP610]|uniref:Uncharacterized protein n=1 Tax=Sphaeroforma arctica JP610 TaxID=667725 RepID=A0A0L0FJD2_9EUKA|nr:hypothetical protein SARC_11374 [Sphaeroforma arctica JP610]KNC76118.1 hypothetical protein SARC_11374 [Sphaeroforma arctica JP610]|eukprot:XP_014150020.1 hypothetical protein SARC_11374 [Sphaeroforma arctica JP610]